MASILDLVGHVQQQGELGRQHGTQRRLSSLMQQAYTAPRKSRPDLLSQIAGTGGIGAARDAQNVLGDADEDLNMELARRAQFLVAAPPELRPQMYDEVADLARRAGYPIPPGGWDESYLPGLEKLAGVLQSGDGNSVFSQKVGEDGFIYNAMRDGRMVNTGVKADRQMWFRDQPGLPPSLVGKDGSVTPIGQPRPSEPVYIDPSLPPEVQASIRQDPQQWARASEGNPVQIAPHPAAAPRQEKAPAGYRWGADGTLVPIPGGPAEVAINARRAAQEARKAAEEARAEQKRQAAAARQKESVEAATQLVNAIDSLTRSEGFDDLGTMWGDAQIMTPFIRNDAKDAQAQLKNIAGQVALATMARLKALSATGATGFGSLTREELKLLENSIATLQSEEISNEQLRRSLKVIRDTMAKVAEWRPPGQQPEPSTGQGQTRRLRFNPATGRIE